ncbi:MAG: biosynthetic arginine decarboxylase [Planctomycetes bacterium]|nr:biosynthetic arginine decarboxylase [Planctomycetota bacterium]NOG55370.1 biosynthetic arginine decarboxylase [Planctomycetota bacterium]
MSSGKKSRTPIKPLEPRWSAADSAELYQIKAWGKDYFDINDAGHVVVRPEQERHSEIDLYEVVQGLRDRGLSAPVLVRFSDIVSHRLRHLHAAFSRAIDENSYTGSYTAVYPIKVNQQRPVVDEVYQFGKEFGFGLEVGSKPELLAVMALTDGSPDRLIICNGFKDNGYLQAVLLAGKLGRLIIPVIENMGELRRIIKLAKTFHVRPRLGVRVKLASQGAGRWRESSGAKSKFGLFVSELVELLDELKAEGMEDCLQLVHCHTGSQVQEIRRVKDAVAELAHVYAELKLMGAGVRYLDVGGGLGVDYDGSQTNFPSSMNYTLDEYANEIVYRINTVCNERDVEHPTIITESGRAIAAYHSVMVFNVLGLTSLDRFRVTERPPNAESDTDELPPPIRDLFDAHDNVTERRLIESYHDVMQAREQAIHLFNAGYLSLVNRGLAERLFWVTCARIRDLARKMPQVPEELEELETILGDTYYCNMSIFQSLPDSWAIGQLFPIMPIHRLTERPTRKAILADITCDSDGKIDRFVDLRDIRKTLDLHDLEAGEEYYLAAFLVGAYQETLGDLHNLFGDTHVVHIRLHEDGGWWIEEVVRGDTAAEVLSYVQYDVRRLYPRVSRDCERAVRDGCMTLAESQSLLRFYEVELNGYTYLAPEIPEGAAQREPGRADP